MSRNKFRLPILIVLWFAMALRGASEPIYDEKADARRDISSAIADAAKTQKHIVLIFGANW